MPEYAAFFYRAGEKSGLAVGNVVGPRVPCDITVMLNRTNGRPPYRLRIAPFAAENDQVLGAALGQIPSTAVFIEDPDRERSVNAQTLRDRYGLTDAECRIAEALCRHLDLAKAAAEIGISIHTARCQVKQVFAKTGTHKQAELVAALLTDAVPNFDF